MKDMLDKKCNEFLELLASKAPVPGGGSACAYVGAIGMALGSMVGNLTVGKERYKEVEEDVKVLLHQATKIMERLKQLVVKDAECFYPLSQAFKLPRDTEQQRAFRNEKIQEALHGASQVPLEIAQCCFDALNLHEELAKKGTKLAISDIGVGAALCKAALQGAKMNVLINTRMMEDEKRKQELEQKIFKIEEQAFEKADQIIADIENYLMRG